MLLNYSFTDQGTNASEYEAENEKYTDRLVVDRKEKVVAVFS